MTKRVGVIGGGISGLTTAYLLQRKGFDVTVFEASDRVGGNITTIELGGYTIEHGPTSLLRSPKLVELVRLLDLTDRVLPAEPAARKRYILSGGKLNAMGPKTLLNGYFSPRAALGLLLEPFVRSRSPEKESVADFVARRLGAEFVDKAVDPFVSGVYAGDPRNLSMRSAFPKLYEMERDFGSLIVGAFRRKREEVDKKFPRTFSFRGGLRTLVTTLADNIGGGLNLASAVSKIEARGGGFTVNGKDLEAVVIATPSHAAAELVEEADKSLAALFRGVNYPPIAVVVLGVKRNNIAKKLDGFGFLIPSKERRRILGTLFHSAIFPERAPEGHELLITFVGGVRAGAFLESASNEELESMVLEELREILGLRGTPDMVSIKRWPRAIPQYHVGYEAVTNATEKFEKGNPGIYFCSNFYRGVSVGDCVKNAFDTAESIERYLT